MSRQKLTDKPIVVCFHSSAGSSRQWQKLAVDLDERFEVLTPGLTGYRDGAEFKGGEVTLADEADSVFAQLGTREEPIHLVGHSFGGAVAIQFALRYPQHVASLSVYEPVMFSLLMRNGPTSKAAVEISRVGEFVMTNASSPEFREAAAWRFVNYWSGPGTWEWMDNRQRERVLGLMPKVSAEFNALRHSDTRLRDLASLKIPVQLMCGSNTRSSARGVCGILSYAMPNVETCQLRGASHMAPVTNPELVNPVIAEFLDRQAQGRIAAAA